MNLHQNKNLDVKLLHKINSVLKYYNHYLKQKIEMQKTINPKPKLSYFFYFLINF